MKCEYMHSALAGPFVLSVLRDCEGVRAVEVVPAMVCCLCAFREFDI